MTWASTVVLIALSAIIGFLGLALSGAVRSLEELRQRLEKLERDDIVKPRAGLALGTRAPEIEGPMPDGRRFRSESLAGRRHLVALADPGCRGCDELIPASFSVARERRIPAVVVIRGRSVPTHWAVHRPEEGMATLVLDPDGRVADEYASGFTPHVFVVDEGGFIVANGPAADLSDVLGLLGESEELQVVNADAPVA
jgi:hypothetical protein